MMKRKKKVALHQKIHHHIVKHFHRHAHHIFYVASNLRHNVFHGLELMIICTITLIGFGFTNLTGFSQDLYRTNSSEVAQALLSAMKNPAASLKQGNIISIRDMDTSIENTFAKGYCTYGAARISPEFFPYIDETTQQRTWGGNAVDRCKNAADTGYKIGSVPSQGALVIYDAGGKFGSYGHVGKVVHYDPSLKKIIVRDMARVARSTMSDRWEDLTTAQIKCYIYNNKTTSQTNTVSTGTTNTGTINTGTISNTTTTNISSNTNTSTTNNTTTTTTNTSTTNNTTTDNTNTSTTSNTTTSNTTTNNTTTSTNIQQDMVNKDISLDFENLSDIAKHFMTQHNVSITLISKSPLKTEEKATLTFKVTDKKTGENYSGLLPFSFTLLSTNDVLQSKVSNIQMINNGTLDIAILSQKAGNSSIVILMDGAKIGVTNFTVR